MPRDFTSANLSSRRLTRLDADGPFASHGSEVAQVERQHRASAALGAGDDRRIGEVEGQVCVSGDE